MEISSIDVLAKYLTSSKDEAEVKSLLLEFGNMKYALGIESEGVRSREFLHRVNAIRNKRIKNYILDWDEDNGAVTLKQFTTFITAVDDVLREMVEHGDEAHCAAASDVSGVIWNRIGDIKIDRRLLFNKDEE